MRLKLLMVAVVCGLTSACSMFADKTPERAYAALSSKDYATAESLYGEMLKKNPNDPWALFNLGVVYQNTGRVAEAKASYEKVVRLNPQDVVGATTDGNKGAGTTLADLAKRSLASL